MKDKIIFWLGNDYTHFCIAHALQKRYDSDIYGICEVTERPKKFFQNQALVNFEKIWFFHDHIEKTTEEPNYEYLKNFEEKYEIDLWKLVQNERIFLYYRNFYKFSPNEILKILEQECRFFENVLTEIKPDFFFTKTSSLHHQELFIQMCQKMGVKVQILTYSPLGKHCILFQNTSKLDYTDNLENVNDQGRDFNLLQNYLKEFDLVQQLDKKILSPGSGTLESLKAAKEFFLHADSKNIKTHYTYYGRSKLKVFLYHLNESIKTKNRGDYVNKYLKKDLKYSEPFVYFPLHTEIERSLLISAPYYTNQIEMIKSIAKSLPINFKLFVKEHPAQVKRAWRDISEYKEVSNIPNVVMVHPNVPNEILYKNCSLLITIAGTPGFEASFYGKPVITMTDMYYSLLPSVNTVKNLEELPTLIKEGLKQKIEPNNLDRFLSILEKNISKFDYADFMAELSNDFFYGGNLVDVTISETKMKAFLERNDPKLQIIAEDHIKKIKWFNESKIKK